ncbi:MAG: extracellular solute-binding protein [Ruminococcaceae bacterium]|nr:extracellular solute-binding protein [Oscillospiraceae bacterium]
MKRFGIFLILAAMLTQLCACTTGVTDETEATTEAPTQTTETTRIQHQLSDELDFGGEKFTAAFIANDPKYYFAEESSSDNMVAAVYRRTMKTEDFLGVDISYVDDVAKDDFFTLYKSGDDIYQLLFLGSVHDPITFTSGGYLYDLEKLPNVDLNAEWWNLDQIKLLQLGKHPYLAVSDFMITTPQAILFNRDMITNNNLENPYDLVFAGTWTLDKLIEMASAVVNDINGDGMYDGEDDIVGASISSGGSVALFTGCDQLISSKGEDGKLELVLNSEKTLSIADKLASFNQTSGANVHQDSIGGAQKSFSTGTVLFRDGRPEDMANVTEYDFDTGIVPMPKYNAEQEEYKCYDWSDVMGISNAIKNPELVGAVMEFLSWDSKNEVFPTYYDVLLKTRYSSDMETREMMNIIFDSIVYEVGGTYFGMQPGFCELWFTGASFLNWGNTNFSAFFRAYKNPARNTIASYYEELAKFEGPMEEETAEETAAQ